MSPFLLLLGESHAEEVEIRVIIRNDAEYAKGPLAHGLRSQGQRKNRGLGHSFYGFPFEGCFARPRDPDDYNDMLADFVHDDLVWCVRTRAYHAIEIAWQIRSQLRGEA